jgi:hypothetical protein
MRFEMVWSLSVSKDSHQTETAPRKFKLGPLGNLNQVTKGLAKTIRAMADGTLDSQVGARICNGLGIMRACFETQKLEQLEERVEKIIDHVPYKRIRTEEAEVYVPSGANGHDHVGATRLISADETERHPN